MANNLWASDYVFPLYIDRQREQLGLTKREYFAAKAMAAIISKSPPDKIDVIARNAYAMADAMLKAGDE